MVKKWWEQGGKWIAASVKGVYNSQGGWWDVLTDCHSSSFYTGGNCLLVQVGIIFFC